MIIGKLPDCRRRTPVIVEDRRTVGRVDSDARGELQRTPLIGAVLGRHLVAEIDLVRAGADWRLGDADGNTALHWAAMSRRTTMLQRLLDAGVGVSVRNTVTDLMARYSALMSGRSDAVRLLIRRGIEVNARDRSGDTAAHWAAKINQSAPCGCC